MNVKHKDYPDRESWLAGRQGGIGASEASCVMGCGFTSATQLWKEKTGNAPHADLSDNKRVQYGNDAEPILRALFALQFKDKYEVTYNAYRIYRSEEYPFLTATLDGELKEIESERYGVLEIKTAWITSKYDLEQWSGQIPQKYYVQVLHQMAVTNASFATVMAQLIMPDGDSEIKIFRFERDGREKEIKYVVEQEAKFWKYIENGEEPPITLTL